jgi:hypothetical protein
LPRVAQIAWELGGVLPRSVLALTGSGDWNWLRPSGMRQLGEVALDELVVTGMTLTGPPPRLPRPLSAYETRPPNSPSSVSTGHMVRRHRCG